MKKQAHSKCVDLDNPVTDVVDKDEEESMNIYCAFWLFSTLCLFTRVLKLPFLRGFIFTLVALEIKRRRKSGRVWARREESGKVTWRALVEVPVAGWWRSD